MQPNAGLSCNRSAACGHLNAQFQDVYHSEQPCSVLDSLFVIFNFQVCTALDTSVRDCLCTNVIIIHCKLTFWFNFDFDFWLQYLFVEMSGVVWLLFLSKFTQIVIIVFRLSCLEYTVCVLLLPWMSYNIVLSFLINFNG